MNIRTSRIERLRQSRTCAFCRRTIMVRTAATLVVWSYLTSGVKDFDYVHPGCGIAVRWLSNGRGYHPDKFDSTWRLYPASTPTSTLRMDSAYVRAGL